MRVESRRLLHDEPAVSLLGHRGEGRGDVRSLCPHLQEVKLESKATGRRFCFADERRGRGMVSLDKNRHASDLGDDLPEQLQPLSGELVREQRDARDVAARPGEARHEPIPDGIGNSDHHDRDRLTQVPRRDDRLCARRRDHVDVRRQEFGREVRQPIFSAFGPSPHKYDVLPLHVSKIGEPL